MLCGYVAPTMCTRPDYSSTICACNKTKKTCMSDIYYHLIHAYHNQKDLKPQTGAATSNSQSHMAASLSNTKSKLGKRHKRNLQTLLPVNQKPSLKHAFQILTLLILWKTRASLKSFYALSSKPNQG